MPAQEKSPNDSKFAELEQKHGECARLDYQGKMFVFRGLSLDEFEEYQDRGRKPDVRMGPLNREMAQVTLVHPSLEELKALLEKKPAIASKVSDELVRMAGSEIEFTVKKG